ncbi:TPA: hypothetical protein OW838_004681 [Escherichia coli]|nr:hypothetical protein [Escherichia coli]
MKLKTVEINGKQYAEIDTAGLPVYVHDDGKEIGFDAPLATKKITELNGEAKKIIAWLKKLQRKNWLSLPLSKTRRRRSRHWKCCQKSTRKSCSMRDRLTRLRQKLRKIFSSN